ncbi:N-acetyltransferase [Microbacteriaceae bacterium VKM Ac-2854]|nr:N-acetyltransferase [Microbacteriaceae bacterium VKM Ac-2854]
MGSPAIVTDVSDRSRFEITVDGVLAGYAVYVRSGERVVFTHTVVGEEWGGQGLGSILAREALASVAAVGGIVVPRCPFIAAYLRKHPDTDVAVEWPKD